MFKTYLMKKLADNKFSVLILGAGLSGLSAAYELKKHNINEVPTTAVVDVER